MLQTTWSIWRTIYQSKYLLYHVKSVGQKDLLNDLLKVQLKKELVEDILLRAHVLSYRRQCVHWTNDWYMILWLSKKKTLVLEPKGRWMIVPYNHQTWSLNSRICFQFLQLCRFINLKVLTSRVAMIDPYREPSNGFTELEVVIVPCPVVLIQWTSR